MNLMKDCLLLQIEYKSRLENIEAIAADVVKAQLLEGPQSSTGQRVGHRKTD